MSKYSSFEAVACIVMFLLSHIYIIATLTPMLIIFILRDGMYYLATCIFAVALVLSNLYVYLIKAVNKSVQPEQFSCNKIEIAEPKYVPIYIAYFVIALSIDKQNYLLFFIIFIMIYLLILKGKFSFFNPYLLAMGYHFYEVEISQLQDKYAGYKIFLISKQKIKNIKTHSNLIRLNDFTYLDKGE